MDPRSGPTHRTLSAADVRWDGARPVSVAYGDVYHDVAGIDETTRVFIEPAGLVERFAAAPRGPFTIGEKHWERMPRGCPIRA